MNSKKTILAMSFFLPILITSIYFIYRGFAPFGGSSVLTVDMAQQYVDFFAYFRHTLLSNPSGFFYSFGKALGGDMLGTWSYYLMSPLNFLILLFPISKLPSVIGIITILKYGLAGLTSGFLFLKMYKRPGLVAVSFATIYSLIGWMVANQLNTIWVDGAILLPVIFWGLLKIMHGKSPIIYVLSLALMLMINYYIGWMIAIFVSAYIVIMSLAKAYESQSYLKTIGKWLVSSLVSGALAAWVLIPTYFALKSSKNNLAHSTVKWRFEFNPVNMIAKFVDGSFSFNQLASGTANLFVGALVIILFIYSFANSKTELRLKIANAVLSILFFLSLSFLPLDLLWHGLAAPVWYPFRFSFIVSFFMIVVALQALHQIGQTGLEKRPLFIATGIIALGLLYIAIFLKKFTFLSVWKVIIAVAFVALSVGLLFLFASKSEQRRRLFPIGLLVIVVLEMGSNLALSLNQLTYLRKDDYTEFSKIMSQANGVVKAKDSGFYRTEKTFSRTRNDALNSNYNGGSAFSSTLETDTTKFYNNTGNPSGVYYAVYANGTTFTDSLLGMKYMYSSREDGRKSARRKIQEFLTPLTSRPDIDNYKKMDGTPYVNIHKNPDALPLGFMSRNQYMFPINNSGSTIDYQNQIATQLDSKIGRIVQPINYSNISYDNAEPIPNLEGGVLKKINPTESASVTLTIRMKKHHSYYMTLGPRMTDVLLSYKVNGKMLTQYRTSQEETQLNIASAGNKDRLVKLQISPNYGRAPIQEVSLFSVDNNKVHKLANELKKSSYNVTKHTSNKLEGTINSTVNGGMMTTTIPYSKGWTAKVDGEKVGIKKWADMFISIPVNAGQHTVTFTYTPVGFKLGIIIYIISVVVLILLIFLVKFRVKKLEN
ncbi:hypothetical protein PL11_001730 [Lentilactobacillus curieae]|uniref:YfhO family protein n=1 Tax=Lentilactobacillus curieae TaxID=1138822 RepID=A0A1S6QGI5_9LACO|nr:YfhO family protein [Lentilactobacillus curieae]AQW20724.1 hypothetical protein PL11_001730 [Lentilactobacillus curieae]